MDGLPEGYDLELPGPREDDTGGIEKLIPNRDGDMRHAADLAKGFDYEPGGRLSDNFEDQRSTFGSRVKEFVESFTKDDENYDESSMLRFTIPEDYELL